MLRIVPIFAGLGNHMFQYAFYLMLKNRYNFVYYDNSHYLFVNDHNGLFFSNCSK